MNTNNKGWFYGSQLTSDSDVAFATDITDISQINDASIFSFGDNFNGSHCDAECDSDGVGEFLIWRNIHTGHYGALRIDDINVLDLNSATANGEITGTWWFQTDGSANLSAVPLPAAVWLLSSGLIGLIGIKKKSSKKI